MIMVFKEKKGFTLMEIIFVLMIILIVYVSGTAAFKSMYRMRVEMVGRKFYTDMNYARNLAMTQPIDATYAVQRVGVVFRSSAPYRYAVYQSDLTNLVADPVRPELKLDITLYTGDYKGVYLSGYTFPSGGDRFEFNARGLPCSTSGTAWSSGVGNITLTCSGNNVAVKVENTGRITFVPNP